MEAIEIMQVRLYDSEPNGLAACTDDNWSGVVYRIPRARLGDVNDLPYIDSSGVYVLQGRDDANRETAYIGQALPRTSGKSFRDRIPEPHSGIENWFSVLVLTGPTMHATRASLLEHELYNAAKKADRCQVLNANTPNNGDPNEHDMHFAQSYLKKARTALRVLGCNIFDMPPSAKEGGSENLFSNAKGDAFLILTAEDWVLKAGSAIEAEVKVSCPAKAQNARKVLKEYIDSSYKLTKDCRFDSLSTAAEFVTGYSVSGPEYWGVRR